MLPLTIYKKQTKAHTIGENLLLPFAKKVVKLKVGEKESQQLDSDSLSHSTVNRRIVEISDDVLDLSRL